MDLGALAPDPEPEPEVETMDLGALAPDPEAEPEVEAMDLGALAPDPEPEPEVETTDLAMETMDLSALAPDLEPEPEVEAMDLAALAPDSGPEPEPEPEVETMDLGALAPDPVPEPEVEMMDLGALAPDPVVNLEDASPDAEEDSEMERPVHTRTLAELYVKQGFTDRALDVLKQLLAAEPGAADIEARIAELEQGGSGEALEGGEPPTHLPEEEEVETLARDLADAGNGVHEVDTPFAWDEEEAASKGDGDPGEIGGYFDDLLSWEPQGE